MPCSNYSARYARGVVRGAEGRRIGSRGISTPHLWLLSVIVVLIIEKNTKNTHTHAQMEMKRKRNKIKLICFFLLFLFLYTKELKIRCDLGNLQPQPASAIFPTQHTESEPFCNHLNNTHTHTHRAVNKTFGISQSQPSQSQSQSKRLFSLGRVEFGFLCFSSKYLENLLIFVS